MPPTVALDTFIWLVGSAVTLVVVAGTMLWNIRGWVANVEKALIREITESRHAVKAEVTAVILAVDRDLHTLTDSHQRHQLDDASQFAQIRESLAAIRGHLGIRQTAAGE